jgi:hypothetical protein
MLNIMLCAKRPVQIDGLSPVVFEVAFAQLTCFHRTWSFNRTFTASRNAPAGMSAAITLELSLPHSLFTANGLDVREPDA